MKKKRFFTLFFLFLYILSNATITSFAFAQKKNYKNQTKHRFALNPRDKTKIEIPRQIPQTLLVVDSKTGKVLESYNDNLKIHPASLVKLMTLYLTFEAIKHKHLGLNQNIYISKNATFVEPSKMGLGIGDVITVKHAIASLVVKSHNDNAVALAEAIAGSEKRFATLMNSTAKRLNMNNTVFYNASGLHHNGQLTTAQDMVKLIMAIRRDHPHFYPLLSQTNFQYRNETYNTHNRVLKSYQHAIAGKTGFTSRSGFNIITHASYHNKDIIAVITGFPTSCARDRTLVSLLDRHLGVTTDHSPFIRTTYANNKKFYRSSFKKKTTKKKTRI